MAKKRATKRKTKEPMRKESFIHILAECLVGNQAGKSIALQLERRSEPLVPWATEWARLRGATPLFGYPTLDEAKRLLTEFLK